MKRTRINLEMTPKAAKRMDRLMELSEASSRAELLRRALAAYEILLDHAELGGTIHLVPADSSEPICQLELLV